jgi:NADP-dependent 3-hydroxy acid dehydrogenase YdfG
MSQALAGTAALVTGASSGIGAATARRLAAEGATVGLVARRRDRLEQLAAVISDGGGSAHVVQADVTDREQAVSAVREVAEVFGRLDTVVNNAGVMLLAPALRVSVVEPGTVDTELVDHVTGDVQAAARQQVAAIEPLRPEDIADSIAYIVTRDRRVAVNEMLVRAGDQTW